MLKHAISCVRKKSTLPQCHKNTGNREDLLLTLIHASVTCLIPWIRKQTPKALSLSKGSTKWTACTMLFFLLNETLSRGHVRWALSASTYKYALIIPLQVVLLSDLHTVSARLCFHPSFSRRKHLQVVRLRQSKSSSLWKYCKYLSVPLII